MSQNVASQLSLKAETSPLFAAFSEGVKPAFYPLEGKISHTFKELLFAKDLKCCFFLFFFGKELHMKGTDCCKQDHYSANHCVKDENCLLSGVKQPVLPVTPADS